MVHIIWKNLVMEKLYEKTFVTIRAAMLQQGNCNFAAFSGVKFLISIFQNLDKSQSKGIIF